MSHYISQPRIEPIYYYNNNNTSNNNSNVSRFTVSPATYCNSNLLSLCYSLLPYPTVLLTISIVSKHWNSAIKSPLIYRNTIINNPLLLLQYYNNKLQYINTIILSIDYIYHSDRHNEQQLLLLPILTKLKYFKILILNSSTNTDSISSNINTDSIEIQNLLSGFNHLNQCQSLTSITIHINNSIELQQLNKLNQLNELILYSNNYYIITDRELELLFSNNGNNTTGLINLTKLSLLGNNQCTIKSIELISKNLTQLIQLNLSSMSNITADSAAAALINSKQLITIELPLIHTLTDIGLLSISSKLTGLTELDISNSNITIAGLQYLTELKYLYKLNMHFCQLISTVNEFNQFPLLPTVRSLSISNCNDSSIEHLILSLPNLAQLTIESGCELTSIGLLKLLTLAVELQEFNILGLSAAVNQRAIQSELISNSIDIPTIFNALIHSSSFKPCLSTIVLQLWKQNSIYNRPINQLLTTTAQYYAPLCGYRLQRFKEDLTIYCGLNSPIQQQSMQY